MNLFIRKRFLPKHIAADIHGRFCLDGAVALDDTLARQTHFVFVADRGEHAQQGDFFHQTDFAEVFHPLFDENAASPAGSMAKAIDGLEKAWICLDAGLPGCVAQDGAGGNIDFFFLIDERDFRHRESPYMNDLFDPRDLKHCRNPFSDGPCTFLVSGEWWSGEWWSGEVVSDS
jgi:hypothetical protein